MEGKLRFRIKRGEYEVELEGDFEYVSKRLNDFLEGRLSLNIGAGSAEPSNAQVASLAIMDNSDLAGLVETTPDGKPHFGFPFESITAKEALAILLYRSRPQALSDQQLSEQLSFSWRTTGPHVVRARASELRKDGKIITDKGRYSLSGAGERWVKDQIIPKLKSAKT